MHMEQSSIEQAIVSNVGYRLWTIPRAEPGDDFFRVFIMSLSFDYFGGSQ